MLDKMQDLFVEYPEVDLCALGFYHILNTILLYIRYLTLLRIVCSNIRVTFLKKDFIQ